MWRKGVRAFWGSRSGTFWKGNATQVMLERQRPRQAAFLFKALRSSVYQSALPV
jgi:hypothetical protein